MTGVSVLLVMRLDGPIIAPPRGLRDRLMARVQARRLDRELADGASPEASAALVLRARRLIGHRRRRELARLLRHALEDEVNRRFSVRLHREAVCAARAELHRLADALDRPGPVSARGVAQTLLLLTDGTGPLYNRRALEDLGDLAARAADSLDVRHPALPRAAR